MQHPDHTDREGEHGARGEGEGWEKETGPEECIGKLQMNLLSQGESYLLIDANWVI